MSTSRLGFASVAALQQYLKLAAAQGLDAAGLCQSIGLPATLPGQTSGQVPGAAFQQLIRLLDDSMDDPILGLRSGDYVQPGSYNVLGYITMSCATLGEAMARIEPYEKLVGDMGVTTLESEGRQVRLKWHCAYTDPRVRAHMIDNVFGSWINYARWLAAEDHAAPLEVSLERPSPGPAWESAYRERWRCPVRFDQGVNMVVVSKQLLDLPLRQPDPLLRQTLEEHAHARLAGCDQDQSVVAKVRNAIYQQLRTGVTRQDMVAQQVGMTSRSLQRHLNEQGLSYQGVLDEIREQLACDYLAGQRLPVEEIAARLGFADARSFRRRFKAWTGQSPVAYRNSCLTAEEASARQSGSPN